jgi:transcriptional regulator with XRE-family HTH domain
MRFRSGLVRMTPSGREAAGQRIARARRRRGLSQAVLAGLVGRSESWLSQVERGKRGVDSHSVLVRLAEVLRVDIEELTGSGDRDKTGRRAYSAASLIEQAMMGYGAGGPLDGGEGPGREVGLDFLRAQARSAYQAYQATRYDAVGHILPGLIRAAEVAARSAGSASPARLRGPRPGIRHRGRAAEPRGRAVPGLGRRGSRHVRCRALR